MGERFTDSQMLKLVEIYREYECLWNVTSALYKNKDARESAYKQIAEKLNINGITGKEIPKKIKNLRSSYYQELKKIKKSARSGDQASVYKPKVSWFTTADGFFRAFRNKEQTFSNIEENTNFNSDTDEYSNAADQIIEVKIEDQIEISSPEFIVPTKPSMKEMVNPNKRQDEVHEAIDKLDKIAEIITKNTSLLQNKEDEFDVFGKYIASTLRSLPYEFSIIGKTEIQKTLSEIQLRALRQ